MREIQHLGAWAHSNQVQTTSSRTRTRVHYIRGNVHQFEISYEAAARQSKRVPVAPSSIASIRAWHAKLEAQPADLGPSDRYRCFRLRRRLTTWTAVLINITNLSAGKSVCCCAIWTHTAGAWGLQQLRCCTGCAPQSAKKQPSHQLICTKAKSVDLNDKYVCCESTLYQTWFFQTT